MIDSHAHIQSSQFDHDRDATFQRAAAAGVDLIVAPSTDAASCRAALTLARTQRQSPLGEGWGEGSPAVAPAAGIHPGSVDRVLADEWSAIVDLAREPEIVAIGETGLDYHRHRSSATQQRASFVRHLALAAQLDLPAIVHNRDADEDVLRAIADWRGTAVLHCFVGDAAFAERALALGCYLGLGGPLTFRSSERLRETIRVVPLDRVLIETDSPFLAPHPYRRQRNEPAHVRLVAEELARVRDLPLTEIDRIITENTHRAFARLGTPTLSL